MTELNTATASNVEKIKEYDTTINKTDSWNKLTDIEQKEFTKNIHTAIKNQIEYEKEKNIPAWKVVDKKEKSQFSKEKIRSLHKFKIAGVLHRTTKTGIVHSTFGAIAYDNRLFYTTDDGLEWVKVIRNHTLHFNRRKEYETIYECNDLLPYTISYGKEYPSTIQNLLLNIAHSVTMLSKEFMTREVVDYTKKNQRVIIFTAIISFIVGLIIGLLLGQFLHF